MSKPEILAPAGNLNALKVAINNGADAVYLGIDEFNARGNIENFTLENLSDVINYSHLFGVRIYLTLNILLKDDEFEKAIQIVEEASKAGVDAFIIQDIGLCYVIKQVFPNLEIHTSTQMGIQNLSGAKFAKKLGFKRIVLARETSLDDIEKISKNLDVEIEYFVQGALCVSFSGNCYLCSLLAGASGNRGKCKQFCRLPYSLENDKISRKGYLLSTKDFCMVPRLKDLYDRGVKSFKIEGRARREGYVGQAVKTYRKIVDNDFAYSDNDIDDLKKVYNRGDYIAGYFDNEKIIYSKAQNHIGIKIGQVEKVNNGKKFNEIYLSSTHELKKDDVLKFFINNEEVGIVSVNDVRKIDKSHYVLTTTNVISDKSDVRLIVDSATENEILQSQRKMQVNGRFYAKIGEKAKLELTCLDTKVTVESDEKIELAKTSPLGEDECFNQLSKLGDEFKLANLDIDIENVFLAKSQLNLLRRKGVELLKKEILRNYNIKHNLAQKAEKIEKNIEIFDKNSRKQEIIAFSNCEILDKNDFEKDVLIFKPNYFAKEYLLSYYEKYKDLNVYISLPIIASEGEVEELRRIIDKCKNWGVVANNYYALELTDKDKTIIGEGLNVFNSYAVKFYIEQGYNKIIINNEVQSDQEILSCGGELMFYKSYYPEYMNFKHCPVKNNIGGDCSNCHFENNFVYRLNSNKFSLIRKRIKTCQFVLKSITKVERNFGNKFSPIIEKCSFSIQNKVCTQKSTEEFKRKYFEYYDDVKSHTHKIVDW